MIFLLGLILAGLSVHFFSEAFKREREDGLRSAALGILSMIVLLGMAIKEIM